MVNISSESKPDFMSGFFSPVMLVSAHFANIKMKRLEALQSIFSKACRVIAMPKKNRLKRPFPRALAPPMRTDHPFAFALRISRALAPPMRSRIARDLVRFAFPIRSQSGIVLTERSPLCRLHQAPPHVPVAKNMQKPGSSHRAFQPFRFD